MKRAAFSLRALGTVLLLLAAFGAVPLLAQSPTGSITGNVLDVSGGGAVLGHSLK